MEKIFAKDEINKGRQFELDVSRGLAVLFMVAVHVLMAFSNERVALSTFGSVIDFLGSPPAAPVFMFILGAGLVYSRHSSGKTLFKRGIIILATGYLLNFLRGGLPTLLSLALTGEAKLLESFYQEMVCIDILQFAAMAFLFFAFIKGFKINSKGLILIGIICAILNMFLTDLKVDIPFLSPLTDLIWGSSDNSYFPFLSWITYPIAGYLFGRLLKRCKNKDRFYQRIIIGSTLLLLVFSLIFIVILKVDVGFDSDMKYFHQGIPSNLIIISFTLSWISLIYFISKHLKGVVKSVLVRWSRNVLPIYIIHWIIIGWLSMAVPKTGYLPTTVIMVILMALSDLLGAVYTKRKTLVRQSPISVVEEK